MYRIDLPRPAAPLCLAAAFVAMFLAGPTWAATRRTSAATPTSKLIILQQRPDRIVATLPNRIILIAQNVPTAPVVSAQVWVKAGSIYDQQHLGLGMSHFLEHLLSGGATSTRSEAKSNDILGRIGAQTNAATGLNNVHYYINTTNGHTATAVSLLSDWMKNSLIPQKEYQRERSVIQHEFQMDAGEPSRLMWKLTKQIRYLVHPARFPTIGFLKDFLTVSRDEIYRYYKQMYVPNNMIFVVAGRIDPRQVIDQLAGIWANVPAKALPREMFPVEPAVGHRRHISGYADMNEPRLRLAFPGTRLAGHDDYAMDLLGVILGRGDASPLARTVRDGQGLVSSIDSYNASFPWARGFFGVDAHVRVPAKPKGSTLTNKQWRAKRIQQAIAAILQQVAKLRGNGVTASELARAKRMIIAEVLQANQTAQGVASNLAQNIIATGNPDYFAHYAHAIKRITVKQVDQATGQYLDPHKLITVKVLPEPRGYKAEPDTRPKPNAAAAKAPEHPFKLDNSRLLAEIRQSVRSGGPKNEIARLGKPRLYTLANGMRLIVQRSTLVPAVAMQMYSLGGLLGDGPTAEGTANATYRMLAKGTDKYSATQLARTIESLGANLSTGAGNNTSYIRATALKQDWKKVMGIFADVVLHPTFPQDQWQQLKPRLLAHIDGQGDTWYGQLGQDFRQAYFGDHPWSQTSLGRRSVVASLTASDLKRYYHGHLGAGRTVMAVVGDIEPSRVKAEVARLFAPMPAAAATPFAPAQPKTPGAKLVQKETKKPMVAVEIGFGPGMVRSSDDFAAMQVLSRVLGDFPSGWLPQALRGRGTGLVYAVGAQNVTGLVRGYFGVLFNTSPNQLREALSRAMKVCRRAKTQRVSPGDLQRARATVLTDTFFNRQRDADLAMTEALNELYGIKDLTDEHFLKQVQQVDAGRIQQVARKYLQDPVVLVITDHKLPRQVLESAIQPGDGQHKQHARSEP